MIGSLLLFFSCSQDEPLNNDSLKTTSKSLSAKISADKLLVFKGPEVEIGNGIVRSWISVNQLSGKPVEIGIEMTPGALEGLPDIEGPGPTTVLPLHLKARQLTPFQHIGLNWQNHGHPGGPPGSFTVPHFDFHFYMISNEERLAIPNYSATTHAAFNNFPPTTTLTIPPMTITTGGYMPLNYGTPIGAGEGQMGKHWLPVPPNYIPFTNVMIYGTYDGKIIFVEPMITLNFLQDETKYFSSAYNQPTIFEKEGNYPTMYNMRHEETGNINITLSHFVHQDATPPTPSL
ncbi:hypothetical protein E0I26_15645 [Flavobacterium rhamnosiphilum]|uniref:TTHB210-like domain-containing protein n=1 Tax=Flavobacterium rhamnosiphilum TaxID=2541724 RepID=A0A4V2Z8U9_9FLAO|nr:DUF5602 domain-containing protein [Flavobacterium rhamnosiphilum]TDE41823.1 hypothetical protein E0I26_15645 [Flavobacterium rhamnosiphilum]